MRTLNQFEKKIRLLKALAFVFKLTDMFSIAVWKLYYKLMNNEHLPDDNDQHISLNGG